MGKDQKEKGGGGGGKGKSISGGGFSAEEQTRIDRTVEFLKKADPAVRDRQLALVNRQIQNALQTTLEAKTRAEMALKSNMEMNPGVPKESLIRYQDIKPTAEKYENAVRDSKVYDEVLKRLKT